MLKQSSNTLSMGFLIVCSYYILTTIIVVVQCTKLEQKYIWQELEYAWPSDAIKDDAIKSGAYKVENNLPLGLDVWNDKLFITVPR